MEKIKIAAVSYLNTKPLLYGLLQSELKEKIDLQLAIPSECARQLQSGEVDLGLVPVAIIPYLDHPHIVSDYCIGTVGPVKTVCIYAEQPLEQLTHLYLDHHSRTSVELTKLLLRDYWQLNPIFLEGYPDYHHELHGTTGGLVIGDRTIGLEDRYPYVYDLGEAWMNHTGLPFVFAAWVSHRPLEAGFIQEFNAALKMGVEHIPELKFLLNTPHPDFSLEEYFTRYISYDLDDKKREALELFLGQLKKERNVKCKILN